MDAISPTGTKREAGRMDKGKYLSYLNSLNFFEKLRNCNVIDEKDYRIAEEYLAEKYCIKDGNLYRRNELIKRAFRAIYGNEKKEERSNENNEN